MPLDAVLLGAVKQELETQIKGMRIDKVQQPEKDALLISFRGMGRGEKMLVCASPNSARVNLTELTYDNPQVPPMFCMLLRKHLSGGKLNKITQPPMERVLDFEFDAYDEMGTAVKKHLIFELLGRFSNIIIAAEDGIIIDCIRRVDYSSSSRPVLPGIFYKLPPDQGKINPLDINEEKFDDMMATVPEDAKADRWLLDSFCGISPLICRELCYRAFSSADLRLSELSDLQKDALKKELFSLIMRIKSGLLEPSVLLEGNTAVDFSYMPVLQYENLRKCEAMGSFSKLLEYFYDSRDRNERMRQRTQSLRKSLHTYRDRTARKLAMQTQELKATEHRDEFRRCGDLITANIYAMHKGMAALKTVDFYSEDGSECTIKLDPRKTPQQNAAKYYKDYNKAKNAEKYLSEQVKTGKAELDYLDSVIEELDKAENERDISDIRRELTETGYIKKQQTKKKEKYAETKPMSFTATDGTEILVGRNNLQNDRLTMRIASKTDLWLHTQKIHGSHVVAVLNGRSPTEETIKEAAQLAAYYSKARESHNVPVDYTLVKYVKKPSGARPGMVIYTEYKTIYVNPVNNVKHNF